MQTKQMTICENISGYWSGATPKVPTGALTGVALGKVNCPILILTLAHLTAVFRVSTPCNTFAPDQLMPLICLIRLMHLMSKYKERGDILVIPGHKYHKHSTDGWMSQSHICRLPLCIDMQISLHLHSCTTPWWTNCRVGTNSNRNTRFMNHKGLVFNCPLLTRK